MDWAYNDCIHNLHGNSCSKTLSAAETTLIFSTEPLFGAAFAAVVANECLSEGGWIGSALIIAGCVISGVDWSQHFRRRGEIQQK